MMVDFYAPWCGHCMELEPEYARAAKELEKDGLLLGKVDCDANEELCDEDRWDIEGFPTIKVLRGGVGGPIHDYVGPRSAADMTAFMRQVAAFPHPDDDDDDDDDDEGDFYEDEDDGDAYRLVEEEGVLVLGAHDFERATDHFMMMLVLLYTPGCEGCDAVMEEYIEASDELYEHLVPVAKVDCFLQAELCQQPQWSEAASAAAAAAGGGNDTATPPADGVVVVDGKTPMLFVIRKGEVFGYDGDAAASSAAEMVQFVRVVAEIGGEALADDEDEDEEEDDGLGDDNYGDGDEVDESSVLVLDESNIDQALEDADGGGGGALLLEFFAPWCGNCNRLRPRYARAADALKKEGSPARLAKIDCTTNEDLCASEPWQITKYPTIMLRRFGELYEYDQAREARELVRYMRKAAEPAPKYLAGDREVGRFLEENEVSVVAVLEKEGSDAYVKFKEAAREDFGRAYGVSYDDEVADIMGADIGNKVVVYRHFDDEQLSMQIFSFTKKDDILAFVKGASKKLFLKMGSEEASQVLSERPLAMFVFTEDEKTPGVATGHMLKLLQAMGKEALVASSKVTADADGADATQQQQQQPVRYIHAAMDKAGAQVLGFFVGDGNREDHVPGVFLVTPGEVEGETFKYRYDGKDGDDYTVELLQAFERSFFAGELKPFTKSEPLSPWDEAGSLKVVKADSFRRIVIDNDNDVLVAFYAPWCPHCRRLGPIYEDMAERLAGREKLVVANMDVAANDLDYPGVSAKKLPTVVLFKAGSKDKPEVYDGEHELEPLEAFVNENTHYKQPPAPAPDAPSRDEL
ncbi:Protein disulfide isomerase [Ectocarpus siliculosus]|uniref:Protein disulfide isomerase n=1 Tax=Ectocarpus siliculosus TaxID=2880 RepID=D7G3W6_ECTSI|nr:Protein disulfide isomerase [Ectocarpus siliculosus]|eukprot:CBJ33643.1 Protein disulfide isomerase [Ectocarpus siliculosus]